MISRENAKLVLQKCLETGGDFAEIFEEDTISNVLSIVDNNVEDAIGGRSYGIGISRLISLRLFSNLAMSISCATHARTIWLLPTRTSGVL